MCTQKSAAESSSKELSRTRRNRTAFKLRNAKCESTEQTQQEECAEGESEENQTCRINTLQDRINVEIGCEVKGRNKKGTNNSRYRAKV